ncbi:hypothetical protein ElyMa_006073200 [Elysia marginata]|uniref:ABC transmembrane type-1 domain-containing protein n=1 Tax=Elysia marginata TaxID=1093978 RepID=A0AAV4GPS5_9GAST|nr:hypothetical protein ElyMa_006073200 [Elysia marginata]
MHFSRLQITVEPEIVVVVVVVVVVRGGGVLVVVKVVIVAVVEVVAAAVEIAVVVVVVAAAVIVVVAVVVAAAAAVVVVVVVVVVVHVVVVVVVVVVIDVAVDVVICFMKFFLSCNVALVLYCSIFVFVDVFYTPILRYSMLCLCVHHQPSFELTTINYCYAINPIELGLLYDTVLFFNQFSRPVVTSFS